MKERTAKVQASKDKLTSAQTEDKKARLKAEAKVNEARLAEIAKRNAAAAAAKLPAPAPAPVAEEVAPEVVAEEAAPEVVAEAVAEVQVETAEENTEA